jgi:hypothetical protein
MLGEKMKSLKHIISSIILTLLVILIVLINFNVFYINDLTHQLYETHHLLGEIKENYLEMDLPLRVLDNISSQDLETLSDERLNNLNEAHHRNSNLLIDLTQKNNSIILKSKIMISDYKSSVIFRYFGLFDDNHQLILKTEEKFNHLNNLI